MLTPDGGVAGAGRPVRHLFGNCNARGPERLALRGLLRGRLLRRRRLLGGRTRLLGGRGGRRVVQLLLGAPPVVLRARPAVLLRELVRAAANRLFVNMSHVCSSFVGKRKMSTTATFKRAAWTGGADGSR